MQKMTLDSLLADMAGKGREADTAAGILADGVFNVVLANVYFEIFQASLFTYEKNMAQVAERLGSSVPFRDRVRRDLHPEALEDNWKGPNILNRAVG